MFVADNEFKNANISRSIRFTEKLFEQLNTYAAHMGISFNLLVLQCCKYAMDHTYIESNDAPSIPQYQEK